MNVPVFCTVSITNKMRFVYPLYQRSELVTRGEQGCGPRESPAAVRHIQIPHHRIAEALAVATERLNNQNIP